MLNSALGCLYSMDVGFVSDVSEVNAASVFRIEACRVGEFPRICLGLVSCEHSNESSGSVKGIDL
jgi:hypothetical protein